MKVRDVMTGDVHLTNPERSIREAAQMMAEQDIGALPVGENDRLVGMVTDRDIAVRGVADGMVAEESLVSDVMTPEVRCCRADDPVEAVMAEMGDAQVRRLPVLDADNAIVGVVALGDLATRQSKHTDETLREISTPAR